MNLNLPGSMGEATPESVVEPQLNPKYLDKPSPEMSIQFPKNEFIQYPSLPVSEPAPAQGGTIRGFNDPTTQAFMGAAKYGDIIINAIDSVPSILEIAYDPLRVLDWPKPYVNFGLATSEWIAEAAVDKFSEGMQLVGAAAKGGDEFNKFKVKSPETDFEFPRFDYEMGGYPEKEEEEHILLEKYKEDRQTSIKNYWDNFKKTNDSSPYIAEVVSFAPDILTMFGGALMNIPKMAAATEGMLAGARAETEDEEVGPARVWGAVGGLVGTKVANLFLNNLTTKEMAVIASMEQTPGRKEDVIALLEYYQGHHNISEGLMAEGMTGDTVIDGIKSRMIEDMGMDSYNLFAKSLGDIGSKAKQSSKEVTDEFARKSEILYQELAAKEKAAWDKVSIKMESDEFIPVGDLTSEIDKSLENAPLVIKTFAKNLFKADKHAMEIKNLDLEETAIYNRYLRDAEFAPDNVQEALKNDAYKQIEAVKKDRLLLEGDQAESATELSIQNIVDKIALLNDKAYVKGGNINSGDKKQSAGLNKLRDLLSKKLEGFEDFDEFDPLYRQAKTISSEKFNTFGYRQGKNKGEEVATAELGLILEKSDAAQLRVVKGLMSEQPDVFNVKIKSLEEKLGTEGVSNLKKHYIEKKLNDSLLNPVSDTTKFNSVNPERFEEMARNFIDQDEGRKLIMDAYPEKGEQIVKQLSQVRSLTIKMQEFKDSDPVMAKSWIKSLPKLVWTILSTRISDSRYTTRMIEGYGRKAEFDWASEIIPHLGSRAVGSGIGATLAPEGHEAEGAAAGAWLGKVGARANTFRKMDAVQNSTKKIKDFIKYHKGK